LPDFFYYFFIKCPGEPGNGYPDPSGFCLRLPAGEVSTAQDPKQATKALPPNWEHERFVVFCSDDVGDIL